MRGDLILKGSHCRLIAGQLIQSSFAIILRLVKEFRVDKNPGKTREHGPLLKLGVSP